MAERGEYGASWVIGLVLGGAAIGFLDLVAAALAGGLPLPVIMRAVARGILGKAAMTGGTQSALLGLALQLVMSVIIAFIYGGASRGLSILVKRPIVMGVLYGVAIFVVMNYVVVPLSAVGHPTVFKSVGMAASHLAIMILFGLMVAVVNRLSFRAGSGPAAHLSVIG